MTHREILAFMAKDNKPGRSAGRIGDYISIAVADGWTKWKIVSELSVMYWNTFEDDYAEEIADLFDEFMLTYDLNAVPDPEPVLKKKIGEGKKVLLQGILYKSIAEAALKNNCSRDKINSLLNKGIARHVQS